jgi:putative phage-type endonuclease
MSQPSNQPAPTSYVVCNCQHCDGRIEFNANDFAEENSIVPCPHCGLETKIFIPVLDPEKVSTGLPISVVSPNTVRREGFFCGGDELVPTQIAAEQPATEVWREWQFTIVPLQQGTDDWREWRHNGIGASDASAIMGENRFKSVAQLLQEKRGQVLDCGQNAAMARGAELEPEARSLYIATTGRQMRPACLQSTRYEWLRASLDGLAFNDDAAVEIKCGQSAYQVASQTHSVPDYYYGQMQHILAVTGFDSLDFWCYWPGYPALLIPVPRNIAYIERLLTNELKFWEQVTAALPKKSQAPQKTEGQFDDVNHPERREHATPKQVAYLKFMGVFNADQLSKMEASEMIETNSFFDRAKSLNELERLRSNQARWHKERLILYPNLYADELKESLAKSLHTYVRSQIVGAAERLTTSKIMRVVSALNAENAHWSLQPNHQAVFFERLKQVYPGCCEKARIIRA